VLRLTVISQSAEEVVLQADGWVIGAYIELLEGEIRRYLQEAERLVLDLQGVRSIDRAGIALLREWMNTGLTLRGGSLFVRTLLQEHGLEM
jgi:ABC-type transporter Mla MlaB component